MPSNNHLDWLVGGYYANEKLTVVDNLTYGADYARYANCLVAANFAARPDPRQHPGAGNADLLQPDCRGWILPFAGAQAPALAAFAQLPINLGPPFGVVNFGAPPFTDSGFANIARLLGVTGSLNGAGLDDRWNQKSNNWALFTHNIISITDSFEADGWRSVYARAEETRRRSDRQQHPLHD